MTRQTTYTLLFVFAFFICGSIGNVLYTNHVDEQRAKSDRANMIARQKQSAQALAVFCALVTANTKADEEQPPQTPAGKNKAQAWRNLKVQFGC